MKPRHQLGVSARISPAFTDSHCAASSTQLGGMLRRAHEAGAQSQEHERQAALLAFEQERVRQQQVLQAEHQAALQVMQTERYPSIFQQHSVRTVQCMQCLQ